MNTIGQVVARPQGAYRQINIPHQPLASGALLPGEDERLLHGLVRARPFVLDWTKSWANTQLGSRVSERSVSQLAPFPLWHPDGAQ